MSTRKISDDVYKKIKATGALAGLREKVFDYVFEHGPVTIAEAIRDLGGKRDSSVNARFSELRKMGLIEQCGTVPDPTGGKHVISQWRITGSMPTALKTKRREFWHVVVTHVDDPDRESTRIEYDAESAEAYKKKVGDRFIEIIHVKEVLD
jgi:hypothetical protein